MGLFNLVHILLLSYIGNTYTLENQNVQVNESKNDLIYCNSCGFVIGDASQISYIPSYGATHVENRTLSGKSITVQTLENPFKYFFDVVTTYKANCFEDGVNIRADSWFPGYSWRVCECPHCKYHLGWTFEGAISNDLEDMSTKKTFHALILQSLYGLVPNSTMKRMRSEVLQNMRINNESLPLFLDNPIEIKKAMAPTPAVPQNTNTTNIEEDDIPGGTIVILKKPARNVTGYETNTNTGIRNSSIAM